MEKVLIIPSNYGALEAGVEEILETFDLRWEGKRVLIKPNILSASAPDLGVTTSPALVTALLKALSRRNPKAVFVGDNSGGAQSASITAAKKSGIYEAAQGCYIDLSLRKKELYISSIKKVVWVSQFLDEVDVIINLPKFKTHTRTIITGAIKNMFGTVIGLDKKRVHEFAPNITDFARTIVEIFSSRVPHLNILDGVVGMEGNGPSCTELRNIGVLIASRNGVSLDAVMSAMMGANPEEIPLLRISQEMGLGEIFLDKINIVGPFHRIPNFKMPFTYGRDIETLPIFNNIYKPQLKKEACTQCSGCVVNCPTGAIIMTPYPRIDSAACINCHCCIELCLENAWTIN